jgi:hypothetical protein
MGSLTIESGGTYSATSGTTTITSMTSTGSGDRSLNNKSGGTFTDNNGTVLFNAAGDQRMEMAGTGNVHNLTLNKSDNDFVTFGNLTVEGDLSITLETTHTMRPNNASETLTVTGDVTIVEGKLGDVTNYTGAISFGSLSIESGGTYIATSGTTTLTGTGTILDINGTFTHNNGKVAITSSGAHATLLPNGATLNNLDVNTGSGHDVNLQENLTILGTLDLTASTDNWIMDANGAGANVTLTMGSLTASGTIESAYDSRFRLNPGSSAKCIIQGASSLYPCNVTSNDWYWDYGSGAAGTELANIDFQTDLETHKGGSNTAKITLTGDCEFDAVTVSSGDTLDLNGQRMECSGEFTNSGAVDNTGNGVAFIYAGDFNLDGTWDNDDNLKFILQPSGDVDVDLNDTQLSTTAYRMINAGSHTVTQENNWTNGYGHLNIASGILALAYPIWTNDFRITTGGTLTAGANTITCSGNWTSSGGLIGKSAAVFNGSSEEADFGDPSEFELTSTMTIEAWVKPDSASSGLLQGIVGKVLFGGAGSKEWGLSSNSAKWFFKCGNDTSNGTIESDDNYTTGKWYHIACTKDSSGVMRMYVDGKMQTTTQTVTGDCNPTYNFVMGRRASAADYFFDGTLGLVRIFNTERTVTQIRTDMFNDFSNMDSTTGLVACYQFDKGTGTTIYDSTTNDLDSSSSDATWAGGGTFTYGTSTLDLTGTGDLSYEGNINFYNLKCAASTKTTTVNRRSAGSIYIRNNLYHGGGTLDRSGSVTYAFMGIASAPLSGATSPIDMSNCYVVYWGSTGVVPASTWEYFISDVSPVTLGADVTSNNYFNTSTYETALAGNTLTVNEMKFGNSANAHLNIGSGSLVLANTLGVSTSYAGNQLSAGPGATISGTAAGTTFKSQNDWKVVGTVENLNVTNEELNVTGKIINCTGDIIQQHQSIDAAQQLDYDSAEDRDIILGRDLDKNTELVG